MTDLDDPDCQVAEVGSQAWMGTGENPYRPRYFAGLICWVLGHDSELKWMTFRCRRCKVKLA